MSHEQTPTDHPSLAQHPDRPAAIVRDGDNLWRVPVLAHDEDAMAVPTGDLAAAAAMTYRLSKLITDGKLDDFEVTTIAGLLSAILRQPEAANREETAAQVKALRDRRHECLPSW